MSNEIISISAPESVSDGFCQNAAFFVNIQLAGSMGGFSNLSGMPEAGTTAQKS